MASLWPCRPSASSSILDRHNASMPAQTTKVSLLESYGDFDIFIPGVTSACARVIDEQIAAFVNGSSIDVARVPATGRKDATGNQDSDGGPYIRRQARRQASEMKMGRQEACSEDTKQDQSGSILHQPARRDGCSQKKLEREGKFVLDGMLKKSGAGAQQQNGPQEDPGNCSGT
jgi:hypothetical protein